MESLQDQRERIIQEWMEEQERIEKSQKNAHRLHKELQLIESKIKQARINARNTTH